MNKKEDKKEDGENAQIMQRKVTACHSNYNGSKYTFQKSPKD